MQSALSSTFFKERRHRGQIFIFSLEPITGPESLSSQSSEQTPRKVQNGALPPKVRRTVHTDPLWKQSFSKTPFKPETFNRNVAVLVWRANQVLKTTEVFESDDITIIVLFPCPSLLKHKSTLAGDCCVWTESIWVLMRIQTENLRFKILSA